MPRAMELVAHLRLRRPGNDTLELACHAAQVTAYLACPHISRVGEMSARARCVLNVLFYSL